MIEIVVKVVMPNMYSWCNMHLTYILVTISVLFLCWGTIYICLTAIVFYVILWIFCMDPESFKLTT